MPLPLSGLVITVVFSERKDFKASKKNLGRMGRDDLCRRKSLKEIKATEAMPCLPSIKLLLLNFLSEDASLKTKVVFNIVNL